MPIFILKISLSPAWFLQDLQISQLMRSESCYPTQMGVSRLENYKQYPQSIEFQMYPMYSGRMTSH